jgi:AAA domain
MKIKFITLKLLCRKSVEIINFSPQVTFFHGQISAGKSSIVRLIEFCLGGELERTPAINQELVSVELAAFINEYEVLFERESKGSNQVQVTWKNSDGETASVLAPIKATELSIWEDNIFNLSDLIFYFIGISPLKVRKSKSNSDSPLIRLSFKNILWYCYLDQENLDSSFYKMEDPFRRLNSRDFMRFVIGYYNERLSQLEINLEEIQKKLLGKREAIKQVRQFLERFNYGSEAEVIEQRNEIIKELASANLEKSNIREGHLKETHFVDELRETLRTLNHELERECQQLFDLEERIQEENALKAELLLSRFKLIQAQSASSVLSELSFESCPACGTPTNNPSYTEDLCHLCGRHPVLENNLSLVPPEIISRDLTSRANELEESISRHQQGYKTQKCRVDNLQEEKNRLDRQLIEELQHYDSSFVASILEIERCVATLEERLRGLDKIAEITQSLAQMEQEVDVLKIEVEKLERHIEEEKKSLDNADENIRILENNFLNALIAVGVPGIEENDEVKINRKTWIPYIYPNGDEALKWNFSNAGSGGKKALFNVCYALALHKTASEKALPIPNFLIIDTPMKNIGEDVNNNIFSSFYEYLYSLACESLSNTQFIIVDKEYFPSNSPDIDIIQRKMTPNDSKYPPLISYYRGS